MANDTSRPTADSASNGRSLTSPWASVVRGDSEQNVSAAVGSSSSSPPAEAGEPASDSLIESSGSEAQPETPDGNGDNNASQQRRAAWNRPSNGVVEPASVMGGSVSWPALSEITQITRTVSRSSTDNPKPVSDGSVSSSSQAPIISQPPQRPSNNSAHGNSTVNNPPTRQRRNRNGGGGGGNSSGSGPSQATFNQPSLSMPPPFPVFEVPFGMAPAVLDTSVRGARPVGGSQSPSGNDHSSHRNNNSRRGNYGSRPRGDGQYHNNNNHGGRRDQDRRDIHHHPPQYVSPPMGYMPPPLPSGAGPFMPPPPPVRVFPGFDMASPFIYVPAMPPDHFRAMPLAPSPPPMLYSPTNENSLTHMIVKQIDFYFSDDNLVKDNYLRSNMDDQGWVPIALIASFRRVQQLTKDIPVILESLRFSTIVEVQGDKLRRRDGWNKWLHSSGRRNSDSGTNASSFSAPENVLATSIQEVSLDDATTNVDGNMDSREGQLGMATSSFSHDVLTGESQLTNGDDHSKRD